MASAWLTSGASFRQGRRAPALQGRERDYGVGVGAAVVGVAAGADVPVGPGADVPVGLGGGVTVGNVVGVGAGVVAVGLGAGVAVAVTVAVGVVVGVGVAGVAVGVGCVMGSGLAATVFDTDVGVCAAGVRVAVAVGRMVTAGLAESSRCGENAARLMWVEANAMAMAATAQTSAEVVSAPMAATSERCVVGLPTRVILRVGRFDSSGEGAQPDGSRARNGAVSIGWVSPR